jgi:transcription antitermination factor NusG
VTKPRLEASAVYPDASSKAWFAVYTAPRHEKFVQAQLMAKQVQSFLPLYTVVRQWRNGVRREIEHPLLPGYIFVRLGAGDRLAVLQTAGVLYLVGNGTSPTALDDHEIHPLRVGAQRGSLAPHPFLCAGDTVRIARGPFAGVKGHVQRDGGNLTVIVNIQLIQRSFAIRVDAGDLALAG